MLLIKIWKRLFFLKQVNNEASVIIFLSFFAGRGTPSRAQNWDLV